MIKTMNIKKNVKIEPVFLNKNLKNHIKQLLENYYNKRSAENYYILKILDVIILEIIISPSRSDCIAKTDLLVEYIQPEIGMIITAPAQILPNNKIMLILHNRLNIFVTKGNQDNVIGGDFLKVKIHDKRFNGNDIRCLGEILQN